MARQIRIEYEGATHHVMARGNRVITSTTPSPGTGQSPQTTISVYDNMGRLQRSIAPDSSSVTNEYFTTGELKKTYGGRTYPVEYAYDYSGRMKTLKTWKAYPGSGTATNTWNYDGYRGFLTNKVYADGKSPGYTYTSAGRLKTRTWARGITTTYTNNNAGEVIGIGYSDGATTNVVFNLDRLGRQTNINGGDGTHVLAYHDAGLTL